MTRHRDLTAADLEDLLDGRPPVVDPALTAVLTAARAPGTRTELAGLHAAVDAFGARSPWVAPARPGGPWSGLVAVVSGWPVRLLAALAASTAVAGVSLAAVTGTLPGGLTVPSVTTPSSPPGVPAGPVTRTDPFAGAGPTPTYAASRSATAATPSADPGAPAGGVGATGSVPGAEPSARPTAPPGTADRPADPAAATPGPTRPPQAQVSPSTTVTAPSTVPPAARTTDPPTTPPTTLTHPTGR
jgi:hypothetical protein